MTAGRMVVDRSTIGHAPPVCRTSVLLVWMQQVAMLLGIARPHHTIRSTSLRVAKLNSRHQRRSRQLAASLARARDATFAAVTEGQPVEVEVAHGVRLVVDVLTTKYEAK